MRELPEVPVVAAEDVAPRHIQAVRKIVRSHHGLKAVLDWCVSQEPPILETDVVTQDEFTHDLIVPLPSGIFLVYDST